MLQHMTCVIVALHIPTMPIAVVQCNMYYTLSVACSYVLTQFGLCTFMKGTPSLTTDNSSSHRRQASTPSLTSSMGIYNQQWPSVSN